MIPLQYLWQNHSGAAHRKNVDTPSLGGCRKSPKWISIEIHFGIRNLAEERFQ
jgi:hypothetical protein